MAFGFLTLSNLVRHATAPGLTFKERGKRWEGVAENSSDVHAGHGGTMLSDYVIAYLVLCLVSLAFGLTAQGWKHRTIWRHKMLAQQWRAHAGPGGSQKAASLALIPCMHALGLSAFLPLFLQALGETPG